MPNNDENLNEQPAPQQPVQPRPAPRPQQAPPAGGQPPRGYQPPYGGQPPFQAPYPGPQPYVAAPVQPAPSQKKSRGWIVAIVLIVCLFAFTAFCVKACSDAVATLGSSYSKQKLTTDTVALINLDGTIQYDGTVCSPEGFKELLDEAEDDSHIKALVIRVNSGGGTATAGEEMSEYLKGFSKPVVVSSASINASAAYMISAQSDYIYVAHSTEIGAIGTAMQLTDLSGLLDMLGINMEVITSAEQKDSSYGFRPLTDEERAYYQGLVDEINEVFVQNVAEGRSMTVDEVKELATGMPFTGLGAVANGLADEVGTREDAVAKAAELAGVTEYTTIELDLNSYDLSSLSYLLGETNSSTDVLDGLLDSRAQ